MTTSESKKIDMLNKRLNFFLYTALTILLAVVVLVIDISGFKREIRSELKGLSDKFDLYYNLRNDELKTMKNIIEYNRKCFRDLADQAIQNGTYKPNVRGIENE